MTQFSLLRRPAFLAVAALFVVACSPAQPNGNDVQISAEYDDKIVYTTDADADTAPLRNDCTLRGGTFNECGNVCPTDTELCIEVCAFTCEL